jgi:thymidylate synthase (FAD)
MEVKLVAYTPDPEIVCAAAASTSFKPDDSAELFRNMTIEKARKVLQKVIGYGHVSVIEHANFTFAISGVSRSLTHQLVRHRVASFTQQSQRYVKADPNNTDWFVIPETMKDPGQQERFKQRMAQIAKWYEEAIADGLPPEDARFYMPNAAKTNIVVTMNARELLHFFSLRSCARAQWEIRHLSDEMLRQVKPVAPSIFESAGPNCVQRGYCTEGDLKPSSCNIADIKKRFKEL